MGTLKIPWLFRDSFSKAKFRCPVFMPGDLSFRVAESRQDLEQAFRLLHDGLSSQNPNPPHLSGMRLSKFNALPTTKILIGCQNQSVIGALTLVQKSSFGLPMEHEFFVPFLPILSKPAEISSLSIDPKLESRAAEIQYSLLKFAYHLSLNHLDVTHLLMATSPDNFKFLQSAFQLTCLRHKHVKSPPADAGLVDLRNKSNLKPEFANFIPLRDQDLIHFPTENEHFQIKPYMDAETVRFFFFEKTDILKNLSDYEKIILLEIYPFLQDLGSGSGSGSKYNTLTFKSRRERRIDLRLHSSLNHGAVQVEIHNVAMHGLGGIMSSQVPLGKCGLPFNLGNGLTCTIEGKILWQTPQGHFGFVIENPPLIWSQFIKRLESALAA